MLIKIILFLRQLLLNKTWWIAAGTIAIAHSLVHKMCMIAFWRSFKRSITWWPRTFCLWWFLVQLLTTLFVFSCLHSAANSRLKLVTTRDSTISHFLQLPFVSGISCTSIYFSLYKLLILIPVGAIYTLPFDFFIGDGLSYASQGVLMLYVDNFSEAVCIVQRVLNTWSDGEYMEIQSNTDVNNVNFILELSWVGMVQWILLTMNADRLVFIMWPFWARKHLTTHATLVVLFIILICTFGVSFFAINIYGVLPTTNNLIGKSCMGYSKGNSVLTHLVKSVTKLFSQDKKAILLLTYWENPNYIGSSMIYVISPIIMAVRYFLPEILVIVFIVILANQVMKINQRRFFNQGRPFLPSSQFKDCSLFVQYEEYCVFFNYKNLIKLLFLIYKC